MNREEPVTPQQLDTRIVLHSLKEKATLWRKAEGRMNWRSTMSFLAPVLLFISGFVQLFEGQEPSRISPNFVGIVFLVFGAVSFAFSIWALLQSRLDAILEILRRQESTRS
jgi:predicted membrane channel-forming protein YqfA (hemolysin III family)